MRRYKFKNFRKRSKVLIKEVWNQHEKYCVEVENSLYAMLKQMEKSHSSESYIVTHICTHICAN